MNTPDTERHELGIEHSTGANSTHLLKTTPDTEWTDAVEDIVRRIETLETDYSDGSYVSTSDAKKIGNDIQNLLTSRDTYWKERVRKEVEIAKKWMTNSNERFYYEKELDNLK